MFKRPYSKRQTRLEARLFYPFFFGIFFLLIIFFLFFLPKALRPCGFSVSLPYAVSCEPVSGQDRVVSILKDNTLYLDGQMVSLTDLRRSLIQEDRASSVLIKADHRATIGTLVKVWDIFRDAGVEKISIATND